MLNENELQGLTNLLNDINKAVKTAKECLNNHQASNLYESLKNAHNLITKAKNNIVDYALAHMDE
jgi:hypothetical protein